MLMFVIWHYGFHCACIFLPISKVSIYILILNQFYINLCNYYFILFSFGISKNGRCLIADDMGLGKTFQALAIANYYKEEWPLLIVTTASMRYVHSTDFPK